MRFYSRLDDGQCERLHEATLRVLERTGLIVDEPEGLELLRGAGAAVSRRCAAAATSTPSAPAATA